MLPMDSDVHRALDELVQLVDTMPGAFRGEFELGYWGGVTHGADCWWVRFEADIYDGSLLVTALTATEALDKARGEAITRIPS
jgi:hypothetical protein